jgi:hypothetical protein
LTPTTPRSNKSSPHESATRKPGETMSLSIATAVAVMGGGAFTPANLSSLVFWAQADSLSSSPVSSWSYGAGNLTQGTGGSQPTWTASSAHVNNQPSVLYNGSKVMSAANTSALQLTGSLTICTVIYFTTLGSFNTVVSKGATSEFDVYVSSAGTPVFINSNIGAIAGNAGTISAATKTILTITFSAGGSGVAFYVNGTAAGTNASAGAPASTTNAVFVGQRSDAGTTLNGEQPQVILCNTALSATDLTSLHRYFGTKYNITVP